MVILHPEFLKKKLCPKSKQPLALFDLGYSQGIENGNANAKTSAKKCQQFFPIQVETLWAGKNWLSRQKLGWSRTLFAVINVFLGAMFLVIWQMTTEDTQPQFKPLFFEFHNFKTSHKQQFFFHAKFFLTFPAYFFAITFFFGGGGEKDILCTASYIGKVHT